MRCDDPRDGAPRDAATAPEAARRSAGPGISVKLAESAELSIVLPGKALVMDIGADPPSVLGSLAGGARAARAVGGRIRIDALDSAGPVEVRLLAAEEGAEKPAGEEDLILLDPLKPA